MNTPSISQPNSRKETQQAIEPFLLYHYIIPYTKSISVLLLVLSSSAISAQRLGQEQKPETVNYTSISTLSGHMVKAIVNLPEYINNMPKYYREAQEYSIETQKYNQIQIKEITSNKYFSTARSLADISTSSTTSLGTTLLKPLTKELKSIVSTTLAKPILRRPDIEDNRLVDLLLELQYAKKCTEI
ncbi:TPA: hypothetical protein ACY3XX_001875 [Yersinia enterocolitica]|uniref:Uncharacterized protein n=2 Tax=Yersinia enterocolitica TaxID=630 RepID=A0A7T9XR31_YEREN|nr:hypothetical protein [Yersinia enterocolitica]EHB19847.1 hypothetical protein IOK_15924 [Yersinia enterocolitica subsp. palearctica PhRBD_Ye1]EKN3315419.1 hypothetical protein [Yersinia enterocolitica]EKN3319184.1 hypothetical protein [Yersinia enterocolitica]EKN3323173.1 hypothetical protein [Yersinia enterocolitica]EKN3335090.1 hypothetical protein [Yersinia enterocolitica]